MKKILTILIIFIFAISLYSAFFSVVEADSPTEELFETENLKDISDPINESGETGLINGINVIIGLMQIVGTGISLIMITALGIKYLIASVEEKAEIKKTAMPVLIGAVLLFGAVNLVSVIENFTNEVILD